MARTGPPQSRATGFGRGLKLEAQRIDGMDGTGGCNKWPPSHLSAQNVRRWAPALYLITPGRRMVLFVRGDLGLVLEGEPDIVQALEQTVADKIVDRKLARNARSS